MLIVKIVNLRVEKLLSLKKLKYLTSTKKFEWKWKKTFEYSKKDFWKSIKIEYSAKKQC